MEFRIGLTNKELMSISMDSGIWPHSLLCRKYLGLRYMSDLFGLSIATTGS